MLFVSAETVGLPLLEIKKLNCEEIMVAIKEAMARKTVVVFHKLAFRIIRNVENINLTMSQKKRCIGT